MTLTLSELSCQRGALMTDPIYTIGEYEFNTVSDCLRQTNTGNESTLRNNEASLLKALIRLFGEASRAPDYAKRLKTEAWGIPGVSDHSLYQSISRLRKAFGNLGTK